MQASKVRGGAGARQRCRRWRRLRPPHPAWRRSVDPGHRVLRVALDHDRELLRQRHDAGHCGLERQEDGTCESGAERHVDEGAAGRVADDDATDVAFADQCLEGGFEFVGCDSEFFHGGSPRGLAYCSAMKSARLTTVLKPGEFPDATSAPWRATRCRPQTVTMQSESKRTVTASASWYGSTVSEFVSATEDTILGVLASASTYADEVDQKRAWQSQIVLLKQALAGLGGWIYLEFDIPRLGSRIDAVIVSGSAIIPIEFKVGERDFRRADVEQAWDYALDLKNFHEASHAADLYPLLVATNANIVDLAWEKPAADGVRPPRRCNAASLRDVIHAAAAQSVGQVIDGDWWCRSPYRPTPTIIQAARALYARHTVEAISRSDAGATNLRVTSRRVEEIIDDARRTSTKAIIFVTGVPGAGKTLVGLNIATRRSDVTDATHTVYLSGNGPLVAVLRESLTRDEVARLKAKGEKCRKGVVASPIKSFIQNVHHFRDDGLRSGATAPSDHVVIFDESQRAWNLEMTRNFMAKRKGRPDFAQSEPEFLLGYMDRHADWAAVICLVGGGQEINRGEVGIGAWLDAVQTSFQHWHVYISPSLSGAEYDAGPAIEALRAEAQVTDDTRLHLSVSMRSFRAERVSGFVKAVLDSEMSDAHAILMSFQERYPIAVTRDLDAARRWVRAHARGSERYGLVASSSAMRLKPHAIDVRVNVDPVHYFLSDASDTRSSYYLEDAATEFQIQGLELDWVVMNWDADLRYCGTGWSHHAFRGDVWQNVLKPDRRRHLINAYRVLMTRARQGMVIFVPRGSTSDPTRLPEFYDPTYEYLIKSGVSEL